MAESTSLAESAPVSGADLKRAEEFAREPFVLEGEDAATALAPGTARRRALDAALAELDAGPRGAVGGVAARVLADPRARAAARRGGAQARGRHHAVRPPGRRAVGHADRAHRRASQAARRAQRPTATARQGGQVEELPSGEVELEGDDEISDDEEPLDWDEAEEAEEEDAAEAAVPDDPGAARRFWFEHATGAGKTVAALGFVEASRTGGVLILTHRRNLVDQFNGELPDRGYKKRVRAPLLGGQGRAARRAAR